MFLGTRRPKSQNVSVESLTTFISEEGLCLDVPTIADNQYYCPCGSDCNHKLNAANIQRHIKTMHNTPIIAFGQSSAQLAMPPKIPVENACLILNKNNLKFWTKLIVCESKYFISSLVQASLEESAKYCLEVKISNETDGHKFAKEIVTRSIIHSLETKSWKVKFTNMYKRTIFYCFDYFLGNPFKR